MTEEIKKSYTKKAKYTKEREEIINKLNSIIGITTENNKFILEELKSNEEKQNQILGLVNEVNKYYACSQWPCFNKDIEKKWLSLMKALYKNTGYNLSYCHKMKNGKRFIEYTVNKNL